jgi:hypothetical protein
VRQVGPVNGKPGNPKARVTSLDLPRQEMLTLARGRPDDSTIALIAEVVGEKLLHALRGASTSSLRSTPTNLDGWSWVAASSRRSFGRRCEPI